MSRTTSHAFSLKVAAVGVTVAEWVILRELYQSESAPSALADRLGMTRGAISKLADRLITKDMIVRRPNGRTVAFIRSRSLVKGARSRPSSRLWLIKTTRSFSPFSIPGRARRLRRL